MPPRSKGRRPKSRSPSPRPRSSSRREQAPATAPAAAQGRGTRRSSQQTSAAKVTKSSDAAGLGMSTSLDDSTVAISKAARVTAEVQGNCPSKSQRRHHASKQTQADVQSREPVLRRRVAGQICLTIVFAVLLLLPLAVALEEAAPDSTTMVGSAALLRSSLKRFATSGLQFAQAISTKIVTLLGPQLAPAAPAFMMAAAAIATHAISLLRMPHWLQWVVGGAMPISACAQASMQAAPLSALWKRDTGGSAAR